jgi:hypothetical protein
MQQELLLKAMSYSTIGLLILPLLFLLLLGLRREIDGGNPLRGVVQLGLFLIGLITFITLMAGYFHARKLIVPERISEHMDTVSWTTGVSSTDGISSTERTNANLERF